MVPKTVTEHGGVAGVPEAAQVAVSVIPLTVTLVDVNALKSAIPAGTEIEEKSTMRKRNRVTDPPVLLTNRRLINSVPFAPFVTGVRSRIRFGGAGPPKFESSSNVVIVLFRTIGLPSLCGPGAPRR